MTLKSLKMNQELLHTPQAMAEIPNINQRYFSRNRQLVGLFTNTGKTVREF